MLDAGPGVRGAPGRDPDALRYVRALTVDDAVDALATPRGSASTPVTMGETPKPPPRAIAGGTLLTPAIAHQGLDAHLVDISRIAALRTLRRDAGALEIGALVTHAELAASAEVASACPALAAAARSVGNPQVRAAGTVGGNVACQLARASLPALLLVLGAEIVLRRASPAPGEIRLPIDRVLRDGVPAGALIVAAWLPFDAGRRAAYVKLAWRRTSAKALAAVAVSLALEDGRAAGARIAVSGICVATRLPRAEAMLEGRAIEGAVVAAVAREAAAEPPYAVDADAPPVGEAYRRRLVGHGVARLLREVAAG